MLGRLELISLADKHGDILKVHMERVMKIRLHFEHDAFMYLEEEAVAYEPPCHSVARAYALAFGVGYEDGWKLTFLPRKYLFWWKPMYRYGHSWNVIALEEGLRVVLDIFPEETCSMLPLMMSEKRSVFTYQKFNDTEQRYLDSHMDKPSEQREIELLVDEFRRIDAL